MGLISAHGLSVTVPRGWHGVIYKRQQDGPRIRDRVGATGTTNAVLHFANFPVPPESGDYGTQAHAQMGTGGVVLSLLEFDFEASQTAMFADRGVPRAVNSNGFDPSVMPQPVPPKTGFQWFGHESGRAFTMLAVLGSHRLRHLLARELNNPLSTLRIEPR